MFDDCDAFDLADALNYWLQHNWEGQGDTLYSAHCELCTVYSPGYFSRFEDIPEEAKEIYNQLTRDNYRQALDKVMSYKPED
jgi:hypothetical protein